MPTDPNPEPRPDELVERLTRFRDRLIASDRHNSAALVDEAIEDARRAAARTRRR